MEQFRNLDSNCTQLIKAVHICYISLSRIEIITEILNHAELLHMKSYHFNQYGLEVFLGFCPKIKYLIWTILTKVDKTRLSWLEHQYPTLERFVLDDCEDDGFEMIELRTFFTINPNVRSFSTTLPFIWENRNWLRGSDIKFDELELKCTNQSEIEDQFGLIGELYAQGFYQRLHIYLKDATNDYMSFISSMPGLEKLHINDTGPIEKHLVST